MTEETLTFSRLRKIQKSEERQENPTELEDSFLLSVRNYLKSKREVSGEDREYRNARRVFRKIISLREDKIVKNAKIAANSGMETEELNLLPFEMELFRELRQSFEDHRERARSRTDPDSDPGADPVAGESEENGGAAEAETQDSATQGVDEEPESKQSEESEGSPDYTEIEITSEVPEFMGTDLESYGPYREGEVARVPEENAEILVNRGNAEEVS